MAQLTGFAFGGMMSLWNRTNGQVWVVLVWTGLVRSMTFILWRCNSVAAVAVQMWRVPRNGQIGGR